MRKIYGVMLAMFAVLAFGAVVASAAFAEEALWLNNGNDITTAVLGQVVGELLLETRTILGNVDVLCSGIFDGFFGPGMEDEVTEVLTLSGEPVNNTSLLDCFVHGTTNSGLCAENELAWVLPLHLPWHTLVQLVGTAFEDVLGEGSTAGNEPGYSVECSVTKTKNGCEGKIGGTATNEVGGVLLVNPLTKAKTCELGEGFSEGEGEATSSSGGPLSVSDD